MLFIETKTSKNRSGTRYYLFTSQSAIYLQLVTANSVSNFNSENKAEVPLKSEESDDKVGRDRIFSNARDEGGPYVNVSPPSYESNVDLPKASNASPSTSSSASPTPRETVIEVLPPTPTPEPTPAPQQNPSPEPVRDPTPEQSPTPEPTPSPEPRPETPMDVKIERFEKMRQDPFAHVRELADSYLDGRGSDGRLAVVNNGNWEVAPKSSKIYP